MTSIPVQYGGADLLKVNVQFAYDRYYIDSSDRSKSTNVGEPQKTPFIEDPVA